MTKEDIEILLKDLCARLPFKNGNSKPYLRPLSGMAVEEGFAFKQLFDSGLESMSVDGGKITYFWRNSDGYMFWIEYI